MKTTYEMTPARQVDVYRLWQEFSADPAEIAACLANGLNHPTAAGHQACALALMQVF